MKILLRAGALALAALLCAPVLAADPNVGKQIALPAGFAPVQAIYCPDANGNTVQCPAPTTIVSGASFVRPANTTAYATGQLAANSATAGSVVPITIPNACRLAGSGGSITGARLSKTSTSITNASFRIHYSKNLPVFSVGDGGTLAGGVAGMTALYIGYVDVTIDQAFSDGAKGTAQPGRGLLTFDCATGSTAIYAWIEARGAYTPTSGETFTVAAEIAQN